MHFIGLQSQIIHITRTLICRRRATRAGFRFWNTEFNCYICVVIPIISIRFTQGMRCRAKANSLNSTAE